MADKIAHRSKINYKATAFKLTVFLVMLTVCYLLTNDSKKLYWAFGIYFLWSFGSRAWFAGKLRDAIALQRQNKHNEATELLKGYYDFVSRHRWVDRNRWWVLLSESDYSYLEMAASNLAASYIQLGDSANAKTTIERLLIDQPKSVFAKNWLNSEEVISQP